MEESRYPELWQLICGYFHEDFDLFGNNIEEIVKTYIRDTPVGYRREVVREIEQFRRENQSDMDETFMQEFAGGPDPQLWGHTADSFLGEITRLLESQPD